MLTIMTALGVALTLALAPMWATPILLALALLPRAQTLGPVGILAGVLVGVALVDPLASQGYQVGAALGFPFLGFWGSLTLGVLVAQVAGEVAAFVARAAWMIAVALKQR
jgi:hypothetical protein